MAFYGETSRGVRGSLPCVHLESHQPPAGKLQPLPVPTRPWSDISLDFVTGLPPSAGNTVVLTIVDRFSKLVYSVPLAKLPSTKEKAGLLLLHVFRLHGPPRDVVSDRGPQFISRFWKAFCALIGSTVSLSFGYHPQTNGQTECLNQELEMGLRCLVSRNPATWSQQLVWVEYAHSTQSRAQWVHSIRGSSDRDLCVIFFGVLIVFPLIWLF